MYGLVDPRLIEEATPYFATPHWNTFWALHSTRQQSAMGGFQPISFTEIDAYARLMQVQFEPWEIEVLKAMDRAFLNTINTRAGDK